MLYSGNRNPKGSPLVTTITSRPILGSNFGGRGGNKVARVGIPKAMPMLTHQQPDQGSLFAVNRQAFSRAANPLNDTNNGKGTSLANLKQLYGPNPSCSLPRPRSKVGTGYCGKPIQSSASYSASSHIDAKRRNAIGKSVKVYQPGGLAFNNIDKSYTRSALQRVRNNNCVAPKKKGLPKN